MHVGNAFWRLPISALVRLGLFWSLSDSNFVNPAKGVRSVIWLTPSPSVFNSFNQTTPGVKNAFIGRLRSGTGTPKLNEKPSICGPLTANWAAFAQ